MLSIIALVSSFLTILINEDAGNNIINNIVTDGTTSRLTLTYTF